jgi:hypothetical protein
LGQFLLNLTSATVVGGISLLADQVDRLAAGLFFLNEAINLLTGKGTNAKFGQIADSFKAFFGIDLGGLVQGFIDVQVQQGGYGNGNRRAAGGPVSGGSSYLVGERGPEIFTPMSSGNITSNSQLGGGTKYHYQCDAGMGANGPALGQAIVSAIKRYERTSWSCVCERVMATVVELGAVEGFILDDPVAGVLDNTVYTLGGTVFKDISNRVDHTQY